MKRLFVAGLIFCVTLGYARETVVGTEADGATATGNPVQVGGVDGSGNAQALATDTSGNVEVELNADGVFYQALGRIEGAGNTLVSQTDTVELQLGVIEGNGTTLNVTTDLIAAGITIISVDTTSIDADTTTIAADTTSIDGKMVSGTDIGDVTINNSSGDSSTLDAIEGASNTVVANTALIQAGITIISGDTTSIDADTTTIAADTTSIDGKMVDGTDIGDVTINNAAAGSAVNIQDGGNTITVDGAVNLSANVTIGSPLGGGAETGALLVTVANDSTGLLSVDDNSGKLTVDWNGTDPPIGGGGESDALKVTIANDSTGLVSVDDNGAAISVDDNSSSISVDDNSGKLTVDWNGSDPPIGGGAETDALKVTIANNSTGLVSVDDNGGSLTVDSTALNAIEGAGNTTVSHLATIAGDTTSLDAKIINNGGAESGAILVTVANDSTGLISVDDNSSSLTIDNADITTIAGDTTSLDGKLAAAADGAAASGNPVRIAGKDGSNNTQDILTDTNGIVKIIPSNGTVDVSIENGASYEAMYVRLTDGTNVSSLSGTGDLEICGDGGGDVKVSLDSEVVSVDDNSSTLSVDDGGTALEVQGDAADGAALAGNPVLLGISDGTNVQTVEGNRAITVLASAARTADNQTSDQTNVLHRGAVVVISVTSVTDTPSVVFTVEGKDVISGSYYDILESAAITATGTYVLRVYAGTDDVANTASSSPLPVTWRVDCNHADADSITYSISADLIR